jgi:mitochondrial fission process protein 1
MEINSEAEASDILSDDMSGTPNALPSAAGPGPRPSDPVDLYRDTKVRYLGYANELGESFKLIIPRPLYIASYVVSIGYVGADTLDKAKKATAQAQQLELPRTQAITNTAIKAIDTVSWQMLASVLIPGFTINRVVSTVKRLVDRSPLRKVGCR